MQSRSLATLTLLVISLAVIPIAAFAKKGGNGGGGGKPGDEEPSPPLSISNPPAIVYTLRETSRGSFLSSLILSNLDGSSKMTLTTSSYLDYARFVPGANAIVYSDGTTDLIVKLDFGYDATTGLLVIDDEFQIVEPIWMFNDGVHISSDGEWVSFWSAQRSQTNIFHIQNLNSPFPEALTFMFGDETYYVGQASWLASRDPDGSYYLAAPYAVVLDEVEFYDYERGFAILKVNPNDANANGPLSLTPVTVFEMPNPELRNLYLLGFQDTTEHVLDETTHTDGLVFVTRNGSNTTNPGGSEIVSQVDFDLTFTNPPVYSDLGPAGLEIVGNNPSISGDGKFVTSLVPVPVKKNEINITLIRTSVAAGDSIVIEGRGDVASTDMR